MLKRHGPFGLDDALKWEMGIKSASSSKIEQGLEVLYVNDYFGLGNCYMFTSEDSLLKTINIFRFNQVWV